MASVQENWFTMTVAGSNKSGTPGSNKLSTVRFRISTAMAEAYAAAADETAEGLTTVGAAAIAIAAVLKGTVVAVGVQIMRVHDTALPLPDDAAYTFDKLNVHYQAGTENYMFTIPTRDDDAFTVESDGVSVLLADGAEIAALKSALDAVLIGKNAVAGVVTRVTVTR